MFTTAIDTSRNSTRLDEIANRALRSKLRTRLFILAVAVITLVTAGTIAFGATPGF